MPSEEAESRFDALADSSDALVFVTDLSSRMLYANAALERDTGFTIADFQFHQADNPFIHRDDAAAVARALSDFLASERRVCAPIDNRFYDRWGRAQRYRTLVTKVRHRSRDALLFVCRPFREAAVEDADDRPYRALVESAADAILRLDVDGRVMFGNQQASALVGLSPVELGRARFPECGAEAGDRDAIVAELAACVAATDRHRRFEALLRCGRGELVPAQITLRSLASFGAPRECLAVVRDLTTERRAAAERDALAERMHEAQKLETIGVLAGGIAHDVNNIVTALLANVSMGRRHLTRGEDLSTSFAQIELAAQQASALCAQLLAYAGRSRATVGTVELNALVGDMIALASAAVSKHATFELHVFDGPLRVRGDVVQLQQVVMNVLVNAAESLGDAPGVVRVTTDRATIDDADAALVRVSDTGCGMDAETRRRMFDPFFTTKASGHGLGLAATLGIVRAHHGTIRVESEIGRGTTMELLLRAEPAAVVAPPAPIARVAPPPMPARGVVVVADDNAALRSIVALILRDAGFTVVEAIDGEAAITATLAQPAEALTALVFDVTMPRRDGVDALRVLRARGVCVPALLTTGAPRACTAACVGLEPCELLSKPFHDTDLLAAIDRARTAATRG